MEEKNDNKKAEAKIVITKGEGFTEESLDDENGDLRYYYVGIHSQVKHKMFNIISDHNKAR